MEPKLHRYEVQVEWTGNVGTGTSSYEGYTRDHRLAAPGKEVLACSADPAFRGDPSRYNPEELFIASIASCHMLWYLHLCADAGVRVLAYEDRPTGILAESGMQAGELTAISLFPHATIADAAHEELACTLHQQAHALCFLARSVRTPIEIYPTAAAAPRG